MLLFLSPYSSKQGKIGWIPCPVFSVIHVYMCMCMSSSQSYAFNLYRFETTSLTWKPLYNTKGPSKRNILMCMRYVCAHDFCATEYKGWLMCMCSMQVSTASIGHCSILHCALVILAKLALCSVSMGWALYNSFRVGCKGGGVCSLLSIEAESNISLSHCAHVDM